MKPFYGLNLSDRNDYESVWTSPTHHLIKNKVENSQYYLNDSVFGAVRAPPLPMQLI